MIFGFTLLGILLLSALIVFLILWCLIIAGDVEDDEDE